jgi:putative alpha-1,2-mannosidase
MKTLQSLHKLKQLGLEVLGIFNALSFRTIHIIAIISSCALAPAAQADPVDWVNLYIGTGSGPIGYGGTMPFVTPPFGMTDWTPQTRQNKLGGVSYKYEDTTISVPVQPVDATPSDKSFLFIGGVYDRGKTG